MAQEGPIQGDFGAAFRIVGLVVGPGAFGAYLGFDRTDVKGPWLLKELFNRLRRDSRFVAWGRIASVEEDRVRIRGSGDDLPVAGPPGA
jgi:hypothetical protein